MEKISKEVAEAIEQYIIDCMKNPRSPGKEVSKMTFSERIKRLRTERGMTYEEVGKLVGVGKSTVRKWETGAIANMGSDKVPKLAAALGTTPGYLTGWDSEVGVVPELLEALSNAEVKSVSEEKETDVQQEVGHQCKVRITAVTTGGTVEKRTEGRYTVPEEVANRLFDQLDEADTSD